MFIRMLVKFFGALFFSSLCLALATAAYGKVRGAFYEIPSVTLASSGFSTGFSTQDRDTIRRYALGFAPAKRPPGLAAASLPPGSARQLQKHGSLPPGLMKKFYGFPPELERRLAPVPDCCTRGFVAGRAVLMHRAGSIVVDFFAPFE